LNISGLVTIYEQRATYSKKSIAIVISGIFVILYLIILKTIMKDFSFSDLDTGIKGAVSLFSR